MGFNKFAHAQIIKPDIHLEVWDGIRAKTASFQGREATRVALQEYDPSNFMLSHCTIIASVDTENAGVPVGKAMVDGFQVDRRYPDWLITTATSKYKNNNHDAWERKLLLSCFRTFIGGENYVEHIQIPELSKGKIIDAAARDIGDSIYVDILIATDRKHRPLIAAIQNRQLQTLSMGCFLPGTPVTMADGTRIPIEEVVPGDMVLTHKGRAREVLNKQVRGGRWGMRRISVAGVPDDIEATDNHPFFVLRPAKMCACGCGASLEGNDKDPVRRMTKRFKRGHDKRILNPNGVYSLEEARQRRVQLAEARALQVEQVRADELAVGDYVIFPRLDAETADDPGTAKARLLGYFLAEGSFLKHKGAPVEVQFNFSLEEKDIFVAETVRLLHEAFPGCQPWTQDRPSRNTCTVHVTGRELVTWFFRHGGEYSHRKRLSADAMTWTTASHRALLGAWLNGDGHLRTDGLSVGTTTSYDLACQLHLLAIRCGVPVRMECLYGGRTATVAEAVVNGEARRHEVTGKLASFNLCFPQSAHTVLAAMSDKAPKAGARDRHLRALDDMVIFPITSIEKFAFEGLVHNMEVEEDNSYQVHGVATHNCQVEFTICTKCGNVAYDETQLCPHVKYMKGNTFVDALGRQRVIAELCGHINAEPGSVKFIEASWVANPAFTGAVLRNILSPEEVQALGGKIQVAFSQPARTADPGASMLKAAHLRISAFGEQDTDLPPEAGGQAPQEDADPINKIVDDLTDVVRTKVVEKVRQDINKDDAQNLPLDENTNDSLIKSALRYPAWRAVARSVLASVRDPKTARKVLLGLVLYKHDGWRGVVASRALSGRDLLAVSRFVDLATRKTAMAGEKRIYRAVLTAGSMKQYPNTESYLAACRRVIGRELTDSELAAILDKGWLFSLGS